MSGEKVSVVTSSSNNSGGGGGGVGRVRINASVLSLTGTISPALTSAACSTGALSNLPLP
jgi:hypothetical protein